MSSAKRVFMTGATGNSGSNVLAELTRRGHQVTALVRSPVEIEGCRTVVGSLSNLVALAGEIGAADAIVHLASPRSNTRDVVIQEDIKGTAQLIDSWRGGNFIYASSQTVYGIPRKPLSEGDPVEASCWYDIGKICNEQQLKIASSDGKAKIGVSLRMPVLLDSGPRRNDRQLLSLIYKQCRLNRTFLFDSEEGLETYGTVYIGGEDLGRAVADSFGIKQSGPYNLAGGFSTWREIVETVNKFAGTGADFAVRPGAVARPGEFRLPQSRSWLETGAFSSPTGFVAREALGELIERFVLREKLVDSIVDAAA
jgi:nucleoside-diphosphate-sugar epimerase